MKVHLDPVLGAICYSHAIPVCLLVTDTHPALALYIMPYPVGVFGGVSYWISLSALAG